MCHVRKRSPPSSDKHRLLTTATQQALKLRCKRRPRERAACQASACDPRLCMPQLLRDSKVSHIIQTCRHVNLKQVRNVAHGKHVSSMMRGRPATTSSECSSLPSPNRSSQSSSVRTFMADPVRCTAKRRPKQMTAVDTRSTTRTHMHSGCLSCPCGTGCRSPERS